MQTYTGGCHCGAVKYEVDMDLKEGLVCNCSHCGKKGFVLSFVPAASFKLLQGEDMLTEYRFNKKKIAHLFCKICGVQCFGRGKGPDGSDTVAINLRTIDDLDRDELRALPKTHYNGKDI